MKLFIKAEGAAELDFLGHNGIDRHRHIRAANAHLHNAPARPRAGNRIGHRFRMAGTFETHVKLALFDFIDLQAFRMAHAIDGDVRPHALGDLQCAVGNIGGDDGGGTRMAGGQNRQAANGAAAGDQHFGARQRARALDGMQAHSQRFGKSGHFRPQTIAHGHGLAFMAHQPLAKPALHMRKTHRGAEKPHIQTMRLQAQLAKPALPARQRRIDRHALAELDMGRGTAEPHHGAGDFMTQNHRLLDPHGAKSALVVIMQIRAANAAALDFHLDLMRRESGHRHRFNPQIMRRMHQNGLDQSIRRGVGGGIGHENSSIYGSVTPSGARFMGQKGCSHAGLAEKAR